MPATKRILVLANSIKKGGRCVAGLEIVAAENGKAAFGAWIRPIDPEGDEGTISNETVLVAGRFLRPLDVIDFECSGPANDPFHPEDWKILPKSRWRKVGNESLALLNSLPDESGDLWGAASARTRKVTPRGGIPTLRLIKPTGAVSVEAFRDDSPWGVKHKRILHIEHQGRIHEFSIDDPEFQSRHHLDPRTVGDRRIRFELDPAKTIVTASLTPPFKGHHYKIAATIFEL